MNNNRWLRPWSALTVAILLTVSVLAGGCATRPDPQLDPEGYADYVETNDPLEPFNRAVFQFNRGLDTVLLTPLGIFYRDIIPPIMQKGVGNVLQNLRAPVTFFNDLLQGNPNRAGTMLARFMINSTLGVGGLMDPASDIGLEYHEEDFGQTLAVWGVGEGPFLMLPVLGPSNPRDAVGRGVDSLILDPFGFLNALILEDSEFLAIFSYTRLSLEVVQAKARSLEPLDELERSSLDFYAAIRSAYRQNRNYQIEEGRPRRAPAPTPRVDIK